MRGRQFDPLGICEHPFCRCTWISPARSEECDRPAVSIRTIQTGSRLHCIPKAGMIPPILGTVTPRRTRRQSLADAIFTTTQQRVLGVLFGQPERSYYASELIRLARTGSGAAQRELARLEESGLVTTRRVGHQKHYQANSNSPLFAELRAIIEKTVGLAEPLRKGLSSLAPGIQAAFVYGSVAKGRDRSQSDIDLMVISDSLK